MPFASGASTITGDPESIPLVVLGLVVMPAMVLVLPLNVDLHAAFTVAAPVASLWEVLRRILVMVTG